MTQPNLPQPDWFIEARTAVLKMAGRTFSADDVHRIASQPIHPNNWGKLFARMAVEGIIEPDGVTKSTRKSRHGGLVRTWRVTETITA